jgi:hypothetical protein
MSKRDPLRELSRRFPPPTEFKEILSSLGDQPDMAVAILGLSIIEGGLEKLIIGKLSNITPELEGRLFKNRGPISDLDSKILIAEALGIVTIGQARLLNSLKAVRNVFAHSKASVSFETQEIGAEIRRVLLPTAINGIRIFDPEFDEPLSNKRVFTACIKLICWWLDADHQETAGKSLFWPT